jgi:hypothetical protein
MLPFFLLVVLGGIGYKVYQEHKATPKLVATTTPAPMPVTSAPTGYMAPAPYVPPAIPNGYNAPAVVQPAPQAPQGYTQPPAVVQPAPVVGNTPTITTPVAPSVPQAAIIPTPLTQKPVPPTPIASVPLTKIATVLPSTKIYTMGVRDGSEKLQAIADRYGVTLAQLNEANRNKIKEPLMGLVIMLPSFAHDNGPRKGAIGQSIDSKTKLNF